MISKYNANERIKLAKDFTVLEVYGPVTTYFNKYGEKIQDWDEYGKKLAVKQGTGEGLVYVIVAMGDASANERLERYKAAGNEVTRVEKL